jgi:hypothetical protein
VDIRACLPFLEQVWPELKIRAGETAKIRLLLSSLFGTKPHALFNSILNFFF